jgi:hypothetical protein
MRDSIDAQVPATTLVYFISLRIVLPRRTKIEMPKQKRERKPVTVKQAKAGKVNPKTKAAKIKKTKTKKQKNADLHFGAVVETARVLKSETVFEGQSMKVFLAEGLVAGYAHPEDDEQIEIRLVKLSELIKAIERGAIKDGKTMTSVLLYAKIKGKRKEK